MDLKTKAIMDTFRKKRQRERKEKYEQLTTHPVDDPSIKLAVATERVRRQISQLLETMKALQLIGADATETKSQLDYLLRKTYGDRQSRQTDQVHYRHHSIRSPHHPE